MPSVLNSSQTVIFACQLTVGSVYFQSPLGFFSEIKKTKFGNLVFFSEKKSKGPVQKMAGKVIWANNLIGWHNPHMNGGLETTLASSTRIRSQILNISILHSASDIKPGF